MKTESREQKGQRAGGLPEAWQRTEQVRKSRQRTHNPPLQPWRDTGVHQQHLPPRRGPRAPQAATACRPQAAGSTPRSVLILGFVLRGTDTGPASPGTSCLSLQPAPTPRPKSGLPTSQQSQHLNNGAVWLQALTLHRARLEAPTQHSCPQWRLPAKGPASFPATHLPGAEARGPTLRWLAQAETQKRAWTEASGGTALPHLCLPIHTHTRHTQHGAGHRHLPEGLSISRQREGRQRRSVCILGLKCQDKWGTIGPEGQGQPVGQQEKLGESRQEGRQRGLAHDFLDGIPIWRVAGGRKERALGQWARVLVPLHPLVN